MIVNVCSRITIAEQWLIADRHTARRVADRLFSLPEYQTATRISAYLSMPEGELSTDLIVRNAFQQGKEVFVPYLYKSTSSESGVPNSVMDMVSVHSEEDYEALKPDAWGIPTPSHDSVMDRKHVLGATVGAKNESEILQLIIMPGVAFDRYLARLGHGKGFYDNFLQRYGKRTRNAPIGTRMPFLGKASLCLVEPNRILD